MAPATPPRHIRTPHPWLWLSVAATAAGFALRLAGLADVPPRWDEGWSVAHAALGIGDMLTITAADVHPPLYYLALSIWQGLFGVNLFGARYLSVLMSLPAIPLAFAAACAWSGSRKVGVIAAFAMAWLPLAVYYGAVVRMYALAPSFVLLATWAALRLAQRMEDEGGRMKDRTSFILPPSSFILPTSAFVVGAAGAMLTLYHAAWPLVALGVYALAAALFARRPAPLLSRVGPLLLAIALSAAAYLPWAIYALPQLAGRAAVEAAGNTAQQYTIGYFAANGIIGLTMSQQTGWLGAGAIGALTLAGIAAWSAKGFRTRKVGSPSTAVHQPAASAPKNPSSVNRPGPVILLLPLLTIALTILGVAIAARHWTFNARMVVGAAPALVFLIAWSLATIGSLNRWLGVLAAGALIAVYLNTSIDFVYRKNLEVFDPYDPHTYAAHLVPGGRPNDAAVFNVLSPAGFYALDRDADDPAWSYALTWDPVIEPRERWEARITQLAQQHHRLWLVLYRGLAGKNGDLRGWFDSTFYPAAAEWGEEEVFYGLYGTQQAPLVASSAVPVRWDDLELSQAEMPASVAPGQVLPVALTWRANAPLTANHKIFVHAVDETGAVVAQHDAQPLNDLRPMTSLPAGEDILDHHGLALPEGSAGKLRIVAGIYDPETRARVKTDDGRDAVEIGQIVVK